MNTRERSQLIKSFSMKILCFLSEKGRLPNLLTLFRVETLVDYFILVALANKFLEIL